MISHKTIVVYYSISDDNLTVCEIGTKVHDYGFGGGGQSSEASSS